MNNLQENEEKFVKALHITAAAHPVTQRVQKLNWPQQLHNAEEYKAGLCFTGQRSWRLHKYHKVIHKTLPTDVTSLTQYSSSRPPGIQTPMIYAPLSSDPTHKLQHLSHRSLFQSQLHTLNLNLQVFHSRQNWLWPAATAGSKVCRQ